MFIFWILIVILIVLAVRWYWTSQEKGVATSKPEETPLDILKKKYAGGEISREEYLEKKKDLE